MYIRDPHWKQGTARQKDPKPQPLEPKPNFKLQILKLKP